MANTIYTKQISSLVGGVSQQPDSIRFDGQAQEQVNFYPSASLGLIKRSPSDLKAEIPRINEDDYVFSYERPGGKALVTVASNGIITYINEDGTSNTFNPTGSYLNCANPKRDLTHLMIGDSILMVNKSKRVMDAPNTGITHVNNEALVYTVKGEYGKTYRVILKDNDNVFIGSYTTPDGSSASHSNSVDTSYIMAQVASALQADITATAPGTFSLTVKDNVLYINRGYLQDFQISTSDGLGDTAMYAIKDKVALFADLPRKAPPGFIVAVTGAEGNVASQPYFVEAIPEGSTQPGFQGWPTVSWTETTPLGLDTGLDEDTMPQLIKPTSFSPLTFTDEPITWGKRTVGDQESAPLPSFVNEMINGVFFFKNRLALFSGQTIVLSEAGNFFNYFPTSVATLLDADPIDVTLNSKDASDITHAIPFQDQVMLSTSSRQYALRSEGSLSNRSINITPTTAFNMDKDLEPVSSGSSLFLASKNGSSTEVREYSVNQVVDVNSASTVTAHVPTYIPWKPASFKASSDGRHVAVLSKGEVYIYKYIWSGNEKIQNSWFKVNVNLPGHTFEHLVFMEERLYLFASTSTLTKVVALDLTESLSEGEVDFQIYLDSKEENPTISTQDAESTTYTLASTPSAGLIAIDISDALRGEEVEVLSINGKDVTVKGSPEAIVFGYNYECRYDFSKLFMKGSGQGATAVTAGNTTVLKMLINYARSAGFKVEVNIKGRSLRVKEFFGRVRGSTDNTFGSMSIGAGVLQVPINARTDTLTVSLVSDNHLPSSVQFVDVVLRYASTTGKQVT